MTSRFLAIKDPGQERALFRRRVFLIATLIGICAVLLIVRLAYLQIYQQTIYTTLAHQNLLNLSPQEPNRGLIYDRNGVLLAENLPVYALMVTPSHVVNLQETLSNLRKIITIDDDDLQQFRRQLKMHRHYQPILLRSRLTEEEVARFSVEQYHFPGVEVRAEMIRHYPMGDAFAPIVGFVGRINQRELSTLDPTNYSATNFVGKTGVEKHYENLLHGTVGYQEQETDAAGQIVRIADGKAPISGQNLYLTIDSRLQLAAQEALTNQAGAVVAIDPRNGEVLAFVSAPSFDPNLFVNGISKKDYQALQQADGQPLYNRALQGQYPPGSTIKPYSALEGLLSGTVTPSYSIYDPGWFQIPGNSRIYHNYHHLSHGTVNIAKAIMVSSDVYFYNLAMKMGIARLNDIMKRFGFGQQTGIDLDGEFKGVAPSPEWKKRSYGKPWYPGDTLTTGIGQGFVLETPLQLANGVTKIANRGQSWVPHVLLKTQAEGDDTFTLIKPVPAAPIQIDAKIWDLVLGAMHNVAMTPGGTAYQYFYNAAYPVAGKTGTAQVFSLKENQKYNARMIPQKLRDNSLFMAFAPADKPRIAIGVIVQNGTTPAAAVARQLLDFYLLKDKDKTVKSANATSPTTDPIVKSVADQGVGTNSAIINPNTHEVGTIVKSAASQPESAPAVKLPLKKPTESSSNDQPLY